MEPADVSNGVYIVNNHGLCKCFLIRHHLMVKVNWMYVLGVTIPRRHSMRQGRTVVADDTKVVE